MEAIERKGEEVLVRVTIESRGLGSEGVALASYFLRSWLWGLCMECSWNSIRIDVFLMAKMLS